MTARRMKDKIFKVIIYVSLFLVITPLIIIIGTLIWKGGGVLIKNPGAIVTPPGPRYLLGGKGGFAHALLGSLYLTIPATLIASCLGIGIAVFLQTDYGNKKISALVRFFLDILWGIPSIVYGVFILSILILLQERGSLLAGIIALTLLELPIIARYSDQSLQQVSVEIKETIYSLGTTRWEMITVLIKCALPGIVGGILIGLGRGIGDAASVIFTTGASSSMPEGLLYSATALPVLIFQQASSFYSSVRAQAYAAALILLIIILILNLLSRFLSTYLARFVPGREGD